MLRGIILAVVIATTGVGTPVAEGRESTDPCARLVSQQALNNYKRTVRNYTRTVYLERTHVSRQARQRTVKLFACLPDKAKRKANNRLRRWREIRKLQPYVGPDGRRWAIPWYIVHCESKGNFRAKNAISTAGGAYQILDTTWTGHGGTNYKASHPAAEASRREQHKIAHRIWISGGPGQWDCS